LLEAIMTTSNLRATAMGGFKLQAEGPVRNYHDEDEAKPHPAVAAAEQSDNETVNLSHTVR